MSSELLPPVPLRISNQKAYVWDVDDITTLRTKHRVCGVLTGTLPHLAQQNLFLGLPLILMPEEVVLLVDKQLAVLIDDPSSHRRATIAQLQAYNAARIESANHQIALAEAREVKEAAEAGRAMSEKALQKRKEREEKRVREAALKGATVGLSTPLVPDRKLEIEGEGKDKDKSGFDEPAGTQPPLLDGKHAYSIVIPASSTSFDWYDTSGSVYVTIASAKEAGIWNFPCSLHERAKCGVYTALWERGFFMGGGLRFGGDYLVYPGDPLRYHSHFTATVIDSPISTLRPMEIVAHGRLGTGTKKAHLLCGWDEEKEEVSYFSIEWAGFG